ncbi:MAG: LysM peptidoglycan-binding domain-containing protein [Firmicutes bacterium]|nr:LysM peptidoglycan-binding domain-containing protein [Bacillota bacterium]
MALDVGQVQLDTGTTAGQSKSLHKCKHLASRRQRIEKAILVALGALLLAGSIFVGVVSYSRPKPSYATIVVRQGDTLWTIARKAKPGADPRRTVYQIRQLNELESVNIRPGQTLLIPTDDSGMQRSEGIRAYREPVAVYPDPVSRST